MNFLAIDFETANSFRGSACEIGLVKVIDFEIVEEKSFLIKPKDNYFDWYNTHLHGIDEKIVKNEPEFDVIYGYIKEDLSKYPIVAHNAAFDFSVLRHTLDQYGIEYPETKYCCTYQMSQTHFLNLLSFRLDAICKQYDIQLTHHRALQDATACAKLAIKIFKEREFQTFDDIENSFNIRIGKLFKGGYTGSLKSSSGYKISDIKYDENKADINSPFYQKYVSFIGTLSSMVRIDAQRLILEIGGNITKGVTRDTNFLIIGEQDYSQYGLGFISNKLKQAQKYLLEGQEIELLTENQFIEMISN